MTSNVEREFEKYESQNQWQHVYQKIKNESSVKSISENLSVGEARKPENRGKNRYRDVSPYDHSRVVLQKVPEGDSDYINASLICVPESNRKYILSQGPLENTVGHFWQMVWEQNTKAVIMLNKVIEKGTLKCHQYWPLGEDDDEDEMILEETNLKVRLQEEQAYQHYIVRTLELENLETNEVREVYHFHYVTWPDFGIPSSPVAFLMFLDAVRASGVLEDDVGPAVIHCSAGIGRSGTFCLVDSALVLVEKSGTLEGIDVQSLLISMRSYRMGLIQTHDQLKFSYMAIIAGAKKIIALKGAQEREVNNVLDNYLKNSKEEDNSDDEAPIPPQRVESLPSNRNKVPPPPPPRSYPEGEPANKLIKLDSTDIPQKPPRLHEISDTAPASSAEHKISDTHPASSAEHKISDTHPASSAEHKISDTPPGPATEHEISDNTPATSTQYEISDTPPPPAPHRMWVRKDNVNVWDGTWTDSSNVKNGEQNKQRQHNNVPVENNNPNKRPYIETDDGGEKGGGEDDGGEEVDDGQSQQQVSDSSIQRTPSEMELRQRRREERQKRKEKTKEVISQMKEKQRSSETWKKRKSYIKPIAIGLSILIGTYILYRLVY